MKVNKIVFIGDSYTQGTGAEWPGLYKHLPSIPDEFKAQKWNLRLKRGTHTAEQNIADFAKFKQEYRFDFNKHKSVLEAIKNTSWPAIIGKKFDLEVINEGFDAKSNFHIANRLTQTWSYNDDSNPFKDALVIYGVTDAIKDITYHQPIGAPALKNITIPQLALTINYIKEFVSSRGGAFAYFHINDFPEELYDMKLNPFYYNIAPYLLFERSLHSFLPPSLSWKKWDGKHFDINGHKHLASSFINQLENSDIIRILR